MPGITRGAHHPRPRRGRHRRRTRAGCRGPPFARLGDLRARASGAHARAGPGRRRPAGDPRAGRRGADHAADGAARSTRTDAGWRCWTSTHSSHWRGLARAPYSGALVVQRQPRWWVGDLRRDRERLRAGVVQPEVLPSVIAAEAARSVTSALRDVGAASRIRLVTFDAGIAALAAGRDVELLTA